MNIQARSAVKKSVIVLILLVMVSGCAGKTELIPATPIIETDLKNQAPIIITDESISAEQSDIGLDFTDFVDQSYQKLLLRDPELVTSLGISDWLGVGNDQLTNISIDYQRETQKIQVETLASLHEFDREELSPEDQLTYDIYEWYLDDLVRSHKFYGYDYPVSQFITAEQNYLVYFFTDIHPMENRQDALDYITRLSQVERKFDQLLEGLKLREEMGIIPPRYILQWALGDVQRIANAPATALPFYTVFSTKLSKIMEIDPPEREGLLEDANKQIEESVIPAYRKLGDYLNELERIATNDDGVWKFDDGGAYYAYILHHHTTTDLTAEQIHLLGLEEVERIQKEMRVIFDELGYPADESMTQLFNRVADESGYLQGNDIVTEYENIITEAEKRLGSAFDVKPATEVVVIGDEIGGFYEPPALDGSRPGAFYARSTGREPRFGMQTLAYHEAIPGHHFQLALIREQDFSLFRKFAQFTSNLEGWALYAEQLAYEIGFYQNDPYGNLGRLQAELFRAARLVVDTGIHARRWTFQEAVDYMVDVSGKERGYLEYEVSRYIVWPGQATAYKIGMIKILELRSKFQEELANRYEQSEFHNIFLLNGSMPLGILSELYNRNLEELQN